MANTVLQIRRSSVAGRTPNTTTSANTQFINQGELALNMADFKMFSSNGTAFFEIGANVYTTFVGNSTASGLTANSTGIYSPLLVANIVALNVNTIVSGGTTTTLTASSSSYQHITGTSTQTIKLPDLTTIPTGSAYIIDNDSTSNVTITDSAGTTLIVGTPGSAGYIYSMSNATATGNWGGYAYLPVGAQWGDAGLSYRGYFAVGNTTTANTFVINSTALSTVFSATFSNTVTISNNITFSSGGRIVDSTGSQGTSGQVLTSNGTGNVYWSSSAGLSAGNGLSSNTTAYFVLPNTGIIANSTGTFVNAAYIATISSNNASYLGGTAASGYQTTAGLSANVATLTANNTTYVNGKTEGNLNVNSATSATNANNSSYLGGVLSTSYVNTSGAYIISGVHTYSANVVMSNNYIVNPIFQTYKETVNAVTINTTTQTLDLSTTNIFNLSMANNVTLTFNNPPASGTAYSFMLYCKQDATGSRTITWPATVKWPNGSAPTMSTGSNKIDVFNFFTLDGGTTYLGALSLANTG